MVPPNSASDNDNENDPSVSLVEIEPGVAVVMGDRPLEALGLPAEFDCEVSPFPLAILLTTPSLVLAVTRMLFVPGSNFFILIAE